MAQGNRSREGKKGKELIEIWLSSKAFCAIHNEQYTCSRARPSSSLTVISIVALLMVLLTAASWICTSLLPLMEVTG